MSFTPIVRRKIKRALIRHCFDQGGSWNKLHYDMRSQLKMQDNDKRLHMRDPRNFCIDNIEASEPKLELYSEFLQKVYPEIDLSDEDQRFNEVGLALSEFSIGNQQCNSKEYAKAAVSLAGRLYLSKTYHEKTSPSHGEWVHLILCRAEQKNPFLRIAEVIVSITSSKSDDGLEILNNEILAEGCPSGHKIISLHTGVMCPVKVSERETLYHGISKSPNNIPMHQTFISFGTDGVAIMNRLKDPISPSEVLVFKPIEDYPNIRQFLETRLDTL